MNHFLDKFIFFSSVTMGLVLSPFLGHAQQDAPNRVSVLVVARELGKTVEIVQIPATNVPAMANHDTKRFKPNHAVARGVKDDYVTLPTAKPKTPAKLPVVIADRPKPVLAKVSKPATVPKTHYTKLSAEDLGITQKNRPVEVTTQNTKVAPNILAKEKLITKEDVVVLPPDTPKSIQKPNSVLAADKSPIVEVATSAVQPETAQFQNSLNTNAINYILIGFFLIMAGVVLGLLFGKPAFLVSFAGLVFVILGFLV